MDDLRRAAELICRVILRDRSTGVNTSGVYIRNTLRRALDMAPTGGPQPDPMPDGSERRNVHVRGRTWRFRARKWQDLDLARCAREAEQTGAWAAQMEWEDVDGHRRSLIVLTPRIVRRAREVDLELPGLIVISPAGIPASPPWTSCGDAPRAFCSLPSANAWYHALRRRERPNADVAVTALHVPPEGTP